jgi:hypothetical protein
VERGNGLCRGDRVNRPNVTEHRTFGSVWRTERKKLAVHCVTLHIVLTGVVSDMIPHCWESPLNKINLPDFVNDMTYWFTYRDILRPNAHAWENLPFRGAAVASGTFKIKQKKIADVSLWFWMKYRKWFQPLWANLVYILLRRCPVNV